MDGNENGESVPSGSVTDEKAPNTGSNPPGDGIKKDGEVNPWLARGIQVIGILFSAFGGFLTGLAPPGEADATFAVGVASFAALIILFLCAALSSKQSKEQHRKLWISVSILCFVAFLVTAYVYRSNYNNLAFEFPPGNPKVEYVAGISLTPDAQQYRKDNLGISNAQLLADFGGLAAKEEVWPRDAINNARLTLIAWYVIVVVALSTSVFSLTEGLLGNRS